MITAPRRRARQRLGALAALAFVAACSDTPATAPTIAPTAAPVAATPPTATSPSGDEEMFFKKKADGLLAPGTPAPDFKVLDQNGKSVTLADYKGRRVLMWFFPKADTPG